MLTVVALHVIPAAVFAMFHGAVLYGIRGTLAFFALCVLVGNIVENVGVRTGWPFGRYYFTDLMGPKFLVVPVLLGGAYIGMGYASWTVARLILGNAATLISGWNLVKIPLAAAFVMTAWDLSMDAVWSTVMHAWIWQQGGAYFGVPVSNFVGWYFNNFTIFFLFALYLRNHRTRADSLPPLYWQFAVSFYAASAAGNLLLLIPRPNLTFVSDPSGTTWLVADIIAATAFVSVFVMGSFVVMAAARIPKKNPNPQT
jgi:putative membrane protein